MRRMLMNNLLAAFYGGAIGDSKGAAGERVPKKYWKFGATPAPEQISLNNFEQELGWHGYLMKSGQVTDDTIIALLYAESLINCEGLNMEDVGEQFVSIKNHPIGFGETTSKAIDNLTKSYCWTESGLKQTNGCAVLYRWPIAVYYDNVEEIIEKTHIACSITHNDSETIKYGQFFNLMIYSLLNGTKKQEAYDFARDYIDLDFIYNDLQFIKNNYRAWDGVGARPVFETALYAFFNNDSVMESIRCAIEISADGDAVACAAGILSGLRYGHEEISENLKKGIVDYKNYEDFNMLLQELKNEEITLEQFESRDNRIGLENRIETICRRFSNET